VTANLADGCAVVFAEIGKRFEVGCEATGQPHQFHIPLRLSLRVPTGLNRKRPTGTVPTEAVGRKTLPLADA
jgi:hypothetical protein